MKNIRQTLLAFLTSIILSLPLCAQTQTGYVRTVGRPDNNAGERLSGVQIKVSGLHGAVVSKDQGDFDFDLQGGKDSYQLTSVVLDNYELNEKEVVGRTFGVTSVPQEIVMVSLTEKNKIRRKVEEQVEARYKVKYDDLQKKLESKEIEVEDYRRQLQELELVYDKREQLVSDMVERYSHTDYAILKPVEAQINAFIEQGELEKADSVINTLDISKLEADRKVLIEDIDKKESQLAQVKASKASIDSTLIMAYQGKADIFMANFQNDSAAIYYEKMVAIDTTDIRILNKAGACFQEFLADYKKALSFYESALRQSLILYGGQNQGIATSYNNIGSIYNDLSDYAKALEYYQQALNVRLKVSGDTHPEMATIYNNIGTIYSLLGEYSVALQYFNNALGIYIDIYGENHPEVVSTYINLGVLYDKKEDYEEAFHYYEKALDISIQIFGEFHPYVKHSYNNIGTLYSSLRDDEKALEYHKKALNVGLTIYGENHPEVATVDNNIGADYDELGDHTKALEYYQRALDVRLAVYGELHSTVATSYNNIGVCYADLGDYAKALEYCKKALKVRIGVYGEGNLSVASTYNTLGSIYYSLEDYRNASECFQKSVDIFAQSGDAKESELSYGRIGVFGSWYHHDVGKAMEYLEDKVFVMYILPNSPAAQLGYSDVIYLLEYGGWRIDSTDNLIKYNAELRGKDKTLVFIYDGEIHKEYFENSIGGQLGLMQVTNKERQEIIKQYLDWKNRQ